MKNITAIFIVALVMSSVSAASNGGLTLIGRVVKPDGTALTETGVQFLIQVYGNSTLHGDGSVGADQCLLYQETQTLDLSGTAGSFNLIIGEGGSQTFGSGVSSLLTVFRNPQNNAPAASEAIGAVSCSSGQTKYLSSTWDNDRQIHVTVTTSSTVLNLASIPIRSVPFALQSAQVGGYSSDYLMRIQSSRPGATNNFTGNQFDFLLNLGINAVIPGVPSSYRVTNLLADDPSVAQQVATKNYVDTAIAGVSGSLPTLNSAQIWVGNSSNAAAAVSLTGDATIDNAGKLTVTGLQTKPVTLTSLAAKDTLMYNGSAWINMSVPTCSGSQYLTFDGTSYSCVTTTNSPTGAALNSANIWVGNASNLAEPVTMSGDVTMNNSGGTTLAKIAGTTLTISSLNSGQVLQYNGSQWVNTTISTSPTGQSLTSANMWIGNGSNLAAPVAMSGDGSIDNAGKLTVTGIQSQPVSISSLSSNQVLQYNGSSWVNASLSATLPSLNDAKLWVGNSSNVPVAVSAGGDVTMDDAGAFTVAKLQGKTVTAGSPSSNQVLQYNGSQWVNATISASPVGEALTSAQIWVGNASNLAEPVAAGGDVSLDNAGNFTVNKIGGTTVAGVGLANTDLLQNLSGSTLAANTLLVTNGTDTGVTAVPSQNSAVLITDASGVPAWSTSATATGQVLQYNGSAWLPATISTTPTGQSLTSANMWVGNGSNLAAPVAMSGDASLDNAGKLTVTGIQSQPVSISSLSSNQVLQYNGSAWVNASLSATLPSLNDAKLWVGNSSNVPTAVSAGGDVTMDDAGSFTVAKLQGKTVTVSSPSSNQVLQYNGSEWVNGTVSTTPTGQSLTSAQMWVGNASNLAEPVSAGGDVSMDNAGSFTVNKIQSSPVVISSASSGQVLQYNGSQWLNVTPNYQSTTLASNNVWVGNSSNVASPTAMPTCSAGYYLTYNGSAFSCALDAGSTGSVTSIAATAPLAVDVSTGNVTASMTLTSGHVYVGNASNLAADVALSGDAGIDATGKLSVTGIQSKAVNLTSLSSGQVLQYNGSEWINTAISTTPTGQSLTSANMWVGNGSNLAEPVTMSGDVTMDNAGATTIAKLKGNDVTISSLSSNQVLQYNGSAWVNASLSATLPSLNDAKLWVGNSSNVPTAVSAGGDVTMDDAGSFTVGKIGGTAVAGVGLANTDLLQNLSGSTLAANTLLVTNGTDTGVTAVPSQNSAVLITDASGVPAWSTSATATGQVLQYNGSAWLPATISTTPTGQSLTAANIWVGNGSNLAAPVAMSGDASLDNAGKLTVTGIQSQPVSISSLSSNQVLQYNGSAWVNTTLSTSPVGQSLTAANIWVGNASNLAAAVAMTGDASLSSGGSLTVNKIQNSTVTISSPSSNQILQYNGSSWLNVTPSYQSSTLNDAKIWVGNSSNIAAPVSAGGDITMDDTGAFTVAKLQGKTVTASAPSSNQVLQYNGSQWVNATLSTSPTGQALNSANIWVGNASNLATAVSMTGDITMSNAGVTSYNNIVPITKGGTGVSSYTLGQIPIYDGTKLTGNACSTGQILQSQSGTGFACTSVAGDISLASAGSTTVTALQGRSVASTAPTSGQVLQYNGSAWVPAAGATGSGTSNYVTKWTSSSTLGNSLIYDNGTYVGIGTNNPGAALDVNGDAAWENNTVSSAGPTFSFWKTRNYAALSNNDELGFVSFYGHDGTGLYRSASIASHVDATPASATHTVQGRLEFYTTPSGASDASERMRITSSGTVGIGTSNPQAGLDIATTGTAASAVIVPRDSTANRPSSPVNGMIRYNSDNNLFEVYENGAWSNLMKGYIGGLTLVGKANCKWTAATSWGNMSANSNCNTATADESATSSAKTPSITFANLAPGRYRVTFNIAFENGSGTCIFRISDGTSTAGFAHTSSTHLDYLSGDFNYSSAQTSITFQMQAKADRTNDCYIHGDDATTGMTPVSDFVYKFYVEKIQ